MHVTTEESYLCDADTYWESLFDSEGRTRRELEGCGSVAYEVLGQRREGGVAEQEAVMEVKVEAPGPVRKVFGETTRIRELGRREDGSDRCTVSYRSEKMGERAAMSGVLTCVDQGDGRCRVTLELDIQVKIFGIGGVVERIVAEKLVDHFRKDAAYFNAHRPA